MRLEFGKAEILEVESVNEALIRAVSGGSTVTLGNQSVLTLAKNEGRAIFIINGPPEELKALAPFKFQGVPFDPARPPSPLTRLPNEFQDA